MYMHKAHSKESIGRLGCWLLKTGRFLAFGYMNIHAGNTTIRVFAQMAGWTHPNQSDKLHLLSGAVPNRMPDTDYALIWFLQMNV